MVAVTGPARCFWRYLQCMSPLLNIEWRTVLHDLALVLVAVVVALLVHYFTQAFIKGLAKRRGRFFASAILGYTSKPGRLLLVVSALSIIFPSLTVPNASAPAARHLLEISLIVSLAWLAVGFTEAFNTLVNHCLPQDIQDNIRARRTSTQAQLLRQFLLALILFGAIGAILFTFPTIRSIGAGLFASAGLAGLVLGMAARPTLGNLIAGIQIALTQPIRVHDAVVVEGEFGRVAELTTTYVVVRTWDLRHLVVPLSYFIEKPFQNWTRYSSELIGTVFLYTDYTAPVRLLREKYQEILESSPLWDGKVSTVQVTDAKETTMELRFLLSAANPSATFELRCYVREKLIDYLQQCHSNALPRTRSDVLLERPVAPEKSDDDGDYKRKSNAGEADNFSSTAVP